MSKKIYKQWTVQSFDLEKFDDEINSNLEIGWEILESSYLIREKDGKKVFSLVLVWKDDENEKLNLRFWFHDEWKEGTTMDTTGNKLMTVERTLFDSDEKDVYTVITWKKDKFGGKYSKDEFDFNLTTINKILDEARSLITNNNVSQLFLKSIYRQIIDLYEYNNEPIEELAKELCYSLLEIIFEVKNKVWLKNNIVYVIENLILIGDNITVNKAFEKTLNRDTFLIETVFKKIFINEVRKDSPEIYIKNRNNFKNSDYYKNLSDILI